jgi:hypothetical protein
VGAFNNSVTTKLKSNGAEDADVGPHAGTYLENWRFYRWHHYIYSLLLFVVNNINLFFLTRITPHKPQDNQSISISL